MASTPQRKQSARSRNVNHSSSAASTTRTSPTKSMPSVKPLQAVSSRPAAQRDNPVSAINDVNALGTVVAQRHLIKEEIRRRTDEIAETVLSHSRVMKSMNFTSTTASDLQHMAELYDVMFFDSRLLSVARSHKLSFRWSSRMTSAGGKTIRLVQRAARGQKHKRISYEIALSATLLFQTFGDLDRPIRVTGHVCAHRMDAMQRILEHELIHLAEMLVWEDSNCAASRFQTMAQRMFGHTEHKHDLVTQHERAAKKFNVRVGSLVSFDYEGKVYFGKVNRITRRVTVLVPDPTGTRYDDGHCYRKFYVPLAHLRPA